MHFVDTTLFFSPTSGGVKRYLTAKHEWLGVHTGHCHTILVPGPRDELARCGVSTVAGVRLPGTFNYRMPLSLRSLTHAIDALEPDLIEVGDVFQPAWCAARVASRRNVPLVAFFHSNLAEVLGRRFGATVEQALARYMRAIYSRFDLVLASSRLQCDYLERLGLPRIAYQPLGVDTEVFAPSRRKLDLRRMLELPEDTRLLVFAGRFSEEKNLPILHEAMALLGKPYHLLLVGGGRSGRPSENVSVLPYRRDSVELAQWLASADALVHAGASETFGLVVVEAMACGRPVIGVRAGAIPELIDERVGELAEPDNAVSMVQAIRRLYERDLEALGTVARARVLQRFTWSHALQMQLANYASAFSWQRQATASRPAIEFGSPGS